jgi:ferredoxin
MMAVMITDICINCDACIDECPATAIVSADESPIKKGDYIYAYVKPEKCIECVDAAVPKCADVCPSEACIVWDMPYIEAYNDHFTKSDDYGIRVHQKKGLMSPLVAPRPFRENISITDRMARVSVGDTLELYNP